MNTELNLRTTRGDDAPLAHRDLYFSARNFTHILPGNYLEIGCYEGVGLTLIARALDLDKDKDKTLYGIDPFLGDEFVAWHAHVALREESGEGEEHATFIPLTQQKENLYHNISGHKNITFFETTTEDFLESKTDAEIEEMNISVCLVDGSHHYEYVMKDWELALKAIGDKPGVIIFDDTHEEGVTDAIAKFEEHFIENCLDRGLYLYEHCEISEKSPSGMLSLFKLYMIAGKEDNSFTTGTDLRLDPNTSTEEGLNTLCKVMCNFDEYKKLLSSTPHSPQQDESAE